MKRKHCKMKKILSLGLFLGLILGSIPFTPSVNAKTKSETLAYDKKIEKMEDFKKGKFEKVKVKKTEKGVELELNQEGQGNYITPEIKAPFGATHIGLHW